MLEFIYISPSAENGGLSKMQTNKTITMDDIAKLVGVSKTTISRYVNGRTNLMSAELAARIEDAIVLLGYKPSAMARSLRTKTTNTIGIVVSDISSPFASSLIVGAGDALSESEYIPLFINCREDIAQEEKAISSLVSKGVDGLIVNTSSPENSFLIDYVRRGIPVVLVDRTIKGYNLDTVQVDNNEIINSLILHLKEQGYTRPALFSDSHVSSSAKSERINSFNSAMISIYGYDASEDVYVYDIDSKNGCTNKLQQFLSTTTSSQLPAVIGINSLTTIALYQSINSLKLNMPKDIGLCGANAWDWDDNLTWISTLTPQITTVDIHANHMGREAANLILEKISNPNQSHQTIIMPTDFVPGTSTDRLSVAK